MFADLASCEKADFFFPSWIQVQVSVDGLTSTGILIQNHKIFELLLLRFIPGLDKQLHTLCSLLLQPLFLF